MLDARGYGNVQDVRDYGRPRRSWLHTDRELSKEMDGLHLDYVCPKKDFGCKFAAESREDIANHFKDCFHKDRVKPMEIIGRPKQAPTVEVSLVTR